MFESTDNNIPPDKDSGVSEYMEVCKVFLASLSEEQLTVLKDKYLYHITSAGNVDSVFQNGLDKDFALDKRREDFLFLESLFNKYGRSGNSDFFRGMIMGRRFSGDSRPVCLSTRPLDDFYEVPERMKFLLRNLDLLAHAPYTDADEKEQCLKIITEYKDFLKTENGIMAVLKISVISPPILNSLLGGISSNLDSDQILELFKEIRDLNDYNYQINNSIKPQYIEEEKRIPLQEGALERIMIKTTGICFDENEPGTPVAFNMLTEQAKKHYTEFSTLNNRPPTQEEIASLLKFK